ncbi:YdeI/OmpD-associated family protein [Bdellovibrio sp. HCB337]|uniref:YdeI/OmpD-associated family protein n=1 Tax=Bdellovibrio sp. HCB337 TaxID=3394358 RepID=UPI0039A778C6
MNSDVNKFLKNSKQWQEEMEELRAILLKTKLEENFKWRLPCYSHNDNNIVIIQPFKACLGLMFFKGALLKDPKGVFVNNGPNSQASKRLEFRSVKDVAALKTTITSYIKEAIAVEESGQKVEFKKTPIAVPEELKKMFTKKSGLKKAFEALTPGRQRAYILHFSSAKQSETRLSRIEKCVPSILKGKGLNDR